MLKRHHAVLSCALLLALAGPGLAQTDDEFDDPDELTAEDCQVEPNGDDLPDDDAPALPDAEAVPGQPDQEADAADDESLSELLDPCNGVLKPPAIGDQEMTTPPPDEGETPIIRPGELPPQPPSDG